MDPDPDPSPDVTTFFIDLKDVKKYCFFHIFSHNCPHPLQSKKLNFLLKFCVKCVIYFASIISVRSTHLWERKRSGSVHLTNGSGSGSPTLVIANSSIGFHTPCFCKNRTSLCAHAPGRVARRAWCPAGQVCGWPGSAATPGCGCGQRRGAAGDTWYPGVRPPPPPHPPRPPAPGRRAPADRSTYPLQE